MRKSSIRAALFPMTLAASIVLSAVGLYLVLQAPPISPDSSDSRQWVGCAILVAGAFGTLVSPLALGLFMQLRDSGDKSALHQEQLLSTLSDRLSALTVLLNVVTEQQMLSDRAKSVAYREKDRDALRRAIREEMGRGDWEAARVLVDEMEATFGYRQEAEGFRTEITEAKLAGVRKLLQEAQERIDHCCRMEDWAGAQKEASRFLSLYPDFEPARRVPSDIEQRRQVFKQKLLDRWNEAVRLHDGDAGIEVLKLLDSYLTPAEAERMAESARSIFNDRKAKLRDQFTTAVTSRQWTEAIRLGEQIQREFPNAKFAFEIRDTMDTLRSRAAEAQIATT